MRNTRPGVLYVDSMHRGYVKEKYYVKKLGEHQLTVDVVWTQGDVVRVATVNTTFNVVEPNVDTSRSEDVRVASTNESAPGLGTLGVVAMCFLAIAAYKKRK